MNLEKTKKGFIVKFAVIASLLFGCLCFSVLCVTNVAHADGFSVSASWPDNQNGLQQAIDKQPISVIIDGKECTCIYTEKHDAQGYINCDYWNLNNKNSNIGIILFKNTDTTYSYTQAYLRYDIEANMRVEGVVLSSGVNTTLNDLWLLTSWGTGRYYSEIKIIGSTCETLLTHMFYGSHLKDAYAYLDEKIINNSKTNNLTCYCFYHQGYYTHKKDCISEKTIDKHTRKNPMTGWYQDNFETQVYDEVLCPYYSRTLGAKESYEIDEDKYTLDMIRLQANSF